MLRFREQHTGSNTDREPEELCSETGGPKMCQHDTLYSHNNDRPLFLGMAGGQRFVPLLWAALALGGPLVASSLARLGGGLVGLSDMVAEWAAAVAEAGPHDPI